jgi:hypothetical protein
MSYLGEYQAQMKHRLETEALAAKKFPAGFPQQVTSNLVWEGDSK